MTQENKKRDFGNGYNHGQKAVNGFDYFGVFHTGVHQRGGTNTGRNKIVFNKRLLAELGIEERTETRDKGYELMEKADADQTEA